MKIQSLHIYPIKSLGGISLQSAKLLGRGLAFDRRWMLVDSNGVFISQRKYPQLALFSVQLEPNYLSIYSGTNGATVKIPLLPIGENLEVTVWDDSVKAMEVSEEVSDWFSNQLGKTVRLVYMPDESERLIDNSYAHNGEVVSFADGYPLLLCNIASLDDLNMRLATKVEMGRFRPNIVVDGQVPFKEDDWSLITIGSVKIEVVKLCARCVMVNINPANATKEIEVLQALANYRKKGTKVYFGVNALVHQIGEVKVGDELVFG